VSVNAAEGFFIYLCRRCFHGQVYCSVECRKAGYAEKHRKVQRKYRQTGKGKEQHILSEKRRRKRQKKGSGSKNEIQTCLCLRMKAREEKQLDIKTCCSCGKTGYPVQVFDRRGYR
jgi:hypothetical protein